MKPELSSRDEKGAVLKMSIYWICVAALLAASSSPALPNNASWNGTWKLDRAKSHTGETFTYSMNANGTVRYSNGGPLHYIFACDGKDYTEMPGYTTACKKVSDTAYNGTDKQNGKVVETWQQVISSEGRTMSLTTKLTRPDGSPYTDVETYERVSGTSGLIGEWKHVHVKRTPADIMTISISGTTLTLRVPRYKSSITAKLDGSDATLTGPAGQPEATMSLKLLDSRQIYEVEKWNGKVIAEDTLTLSADGTRITDVMSFDWPRPVRRTYVFEKQ
jgi:hypothetical protein